MIQQLQLLSTCRSMQVRMKQICFAEEGTRALPGTITAAAAGLLEGSSKRTPHLAALDSIQQMLQPLSTEVVEEQQVPGIGRFIATADGRVKVLFEDRWVVGRSPSASSSCSTFFVQKTPLCFVAVEKAL